MNSDPHFGRWMAVAFAMVVLVGSAALGAATRERHPNGASGAPAPAVGSLPPTEGPPSESAVLYPDAHPDEFAKGRQWLAERLAASPSDADRRRLAESGRALEERYAARAEALLADRTAAARALAKEGDLDGMAAKLADWPAEFADSPQAAKAKGVIEDLRAEALAGGQKLLDEGTAALSRWDASRASDVEEARAFLSRLDAFEPHAPREPAQRARLQDLGKQVRAFVERLDRDRSERTDREAIAAALAKADAGDPAGCRTLLERFADGSGAATALRGFAVDVVRLGREADEALGSRLAKLEDQAWAAFLDGSMFIGKLDAPPSTRSVFRPWWTADPKGSPAPPVFADLLAAVPDADRAAAWLLLVGMPGGAEAIGSADGAARRLLAAMGHVSRPPSDNRGAAWGSVMARFPLLVRPPDGPVPNMDAGDDAVLRAWLEAVRAPPRAAGDAKKPAAKPPPVVAAARDAFLADNLVKAWGLLREAAVAAPKDPEVALLESHVLGSLAAPYPTLGVTLLALEEARRAWDLGPASPAGAKRVAERCLDFRSRYPSPMADALAPVTRAACEEALRLGQADAGMLAYVGERRLEESKPKDAAPLVRKAAHDAPNDPLVIFLLARVEEALGDADKAREILVAARNRFGASFPDAAQAMLDRLLKR